MNLFKKLTSVALSGLMLATGLPNVFASRKNSEYKKISLDVDVLVLQTPGTDATKFLKRFFDKDAPYYEKDEFKQTTGVIDHSSLKHPKKFEMIKSSLDPVEDWEGYPNKDFYEEIDKDTFKFKCEYREESGNMGKELYIYNTTFKIFRINDVREIYSPELVEQIKKSNSIFELFDLKNKDNFFTIENVKGVINGMRAIDPEHYDMPVLDNCEIKQIDFQLQMPEFEKYFINECCNYTFFNHISGQDMFIAYWNYLTRGGRLYRKDKKATESKPSNTCNLGKNILYGGLGLAGLGAVAGACYGIYKGANKIYNKITDKSLPKKSVQNINKLKV